MTQEKKTVNGLPFVKLAHTVIWAFFVSCIVLVVWSGITGQTSVFSWIAAAFVCMEGLVLLVFRGVCPLTKIARRFSDSAEHNFDIFLPGWLAKYNKQIFTPLFLMGLGMMLYRFFGS